MIQYSYMNLNNILKNILIILSLISLVGAIVYRLYSLNNIGIIISLILAVVLFIIIQRFKTYDKYESITLNNKSAINTLLITFYFLLTAFNFYILFTHQTTKAIISPWQVMPSYFFIIYGLATVILLLYILRQGRLSILLISLHYFLSFSVAWIVYKIGYGFDPFIHQATMDLIDKTGSVLPKPFYYLGQYSLIIILHKITFIPIVWLDKLLVPVLAAIYLPITIYQALSKWFINNLSSILLILIILILPFSFLIVTTPQNFAYLLLLLVILLGLSCKNIYDLILIYLLALTALLIQPIAGIPALLFTLLLNIYHSDKGRIIKKIHYLLIFVLTGVALPLAFYWVEKTNAAGIINELSLGNALSLPKLIIPGKENFILNFIYLYGFNLKIIIILIAAAGLIIAYKFKKYCRIFFIYFLMSIALGLSYVLTKILPFNFLIDYERSNFPDRVLLMATFFLLPFILTALYGLIDKILEQNKKIKISLLTFLIILITASLYLSYPRFDRYYNSHGYSVSQTDINAVEWINNNAESDYIVLANQQVSAAALREFGFKKYYLVNSNISSPYQGEDKGGVEIFYYPIPTGGRLYQYYLDMVYEKPSRETILLAMDLAGVDEAYFVLNKYWWAFPKILAEAKLEADSFQEFDNNEIYVFRYNK